MTGPRKRALKRFVMRWEVPFYIFAAACYTGVVPLLVFAFPDVSNLWVSIFVLVSGLFSTIGACASALKSNDTEE